MICDSKAGRLSCYRLSAAAAAAPGRNLSTADDLVLHLFAKFYKESCISGNTDQKVAVRFRMRLGVQKGLFVYHVEL